MRKYAALAGVMLMLAACATISPRNRIEDRFSELGLSAERSECLADELDDRLDRSDLKDVADFLANLNDAGSAGGVLDALLSIDNPRVVTASTRAGLACAF
jgi:hypothetical protein